MRLIGRGGDLFDKSGTSGRIMENQAQAMALAACDFADPVAQINPVGALGPLNRAVADGKDHATALGQRHHMGPGLGARALFGDHKGPAGKINPRGRKQDGHLQREDLGTVEILMQAIIIPRSIAQ
jgi:hypothetical protein